MSSFIKSTLSWVNRISLQSRASSSKIWFWTVRNACCYIVCCSVIWWSSRSKSSLESQRLNMDRALHAAPLIGPPRMNPKAAASAATATKKCRIWLWSSSASVERLLRVILRNYAGRKKDSASLVEVLSSSWASLTSRLRYLCMLSVWLVTGICVSLNVMLLHPACATRYCLRGSFWLLFKRMTCTPSMLTSANVKNGE